MENQVFTAGGAAAATRFCLRGSGCFMKSEFGDGTLDPRGPKRRRRIPDWLRAGVNVISRRGNRCSSSDVASSAGSGFARGPICQTSGRRADPPGAPAVELLRRRRSLAGRQVLGNRFRKSWPAQRQRIRRDQKPRPTVARPAAAGPSHRPPRQVRV
jgi:hypothetical protein